MKILLVYGTLSGSTMTAADIVTAALRKAGHEVSELTADSASKDMLTPCGALVIGSPSWEDDGTDGQPLPEVRKFLDSLTSDDLSGKKAAVFGLGDVSYPHFCGAVDVIESKLKERNVSPIIPSVRIDRYYSSADNETKIRDWATQLGASLSQ